MKRGFTLIELLVVVLIIGILSSIALPQYTRAVEKSRVSEAKITMKAIWDGKEVYRVANRRSPSSFKDLDVQFANQDGSTATGASFSTKNWTYYLNDYLCDLNGKYPSVRAVRINSGAPYEIQYCGVQGFRCYDGRVGTAGNCKDAGFAKTASGTSGVNGCISSACAME